MDRVEPRMSLVNDKWGESASYAVELHWMSDNRPMATFVIWGVGCGFRCEKLELHTQATGTDDRCIPSPSMRVLISSFREWNREGVINVPENHNINSWQKQ